MLYRHEFFVCKSHETKLNKPHFNSKVLSPKNYKSITASQKPERPLTVASRRSVATESERRSSFLGREGFGAQRGHGGLRPPFKIRGEQNVDRQGRLALGYCREAVP